MPFAPHFFALFAIFIMGSADWHSTDATMFAGNEGCGAGYALFVFSPCEADCAETPRCLQLENLRFDWTKQSHEDGLDARNAENVARSLATQIDGFKRRHENLFGQREPKFCAPAYSNQ
jgi:hypothetical protein